MDLVHGFRLLLFNMTLAGSYVLLAKSGMLFGCHHGNSTLWLPSGGFAFAMLLLNGLITLPGIFLGSLLTSFNLGDPPVAAVCIAVGNTLELVIGWWLITSKLQFDLAINHLNDFLLILICAPLIALIGASIDTTALVLLDTLNKSLWLQTAIHWWMADLLGIILVTPLVLVWRHLPTAWSIPKRFLEALAILGLSFLAGQAIFLGWFHDFTGDYTQAFMMFFFLSVTAIRLGPHGVLLALIMNAVQALTGAIQGVGYFGNDIATSHLTNFWLYMLVLSVVGMILAAYISEKAQYEENIHQLAFYDPLTRLANRRLLQDRIQQALTESQRSGNHNALLFFDLDHFKNINDTLGHAQGDALLRSVAQRLTSSVRNGDTVSRLGGDEFVVMLKDLSIQSREALFQAESACEKIITALNESFILDNNHRYHTTASIGVALFAKTIISFDELMKRADIAMYQAKKAGRNNFRFFDPQMQAIVEARSRLQIGMQTALQEEQFHLHYQAQVDDTGTIYGAEALLRWQHPTLGIVSPAEFIPLAEETGMIVPIGQWVLESACQQLKRWEANPQTRYLKLAVNVSARQFWQPKFTEQVAAVLKKTAINPSRLKLELTESMMLDNIHSVIEKMSAIKALGVSFSMDDFGTGHSSLSSLKKLPIDQLKIDRSFVRDIVTDADDAIIVETIIAMAQHLGIAVIAEGVETPQQKAFLSQKQCRYFQGYLFGKPVAIEVFEMLFHDAILRREPFVVVNAIAPAA